MIQVRSRPTTEPVWRAMSAETMYMPEPTIEPTTIIVESKRPSPRTRPASFWAMVESGESVVLGIVAMSLSLPEGLFAKLRWLEETFDEVWQFDTGALKRF